MGSSFIHLILSRVKQIASPGWMHETSAQGWCIGKTQRDGVGREVGGGIRMGNTWMWVSSGSWWWTGKPGVLQSMGLQSVRHDWLTELTWTEVMSDSLWLDELQRVRLPCPSWSPGVCSNSCPLSQWCHPTISSFVTPFSPFPQFFPASRYFPMSQLFASGGQSIGMSASTAVLPVNIQDWFP